MACFDYEEDEDILIGVPDDFETSNELEPYDIKSKINIKWVQ